MLLFLDNCQAREVVSKTVSESSRGSGEDLTCAMGADSDGSLGAMRSMRRRDFLPRARAKSSDRLLSCPYAAKGRLWFGAEHGSRRRRTDRQVALTWARGEC